MITIFRTLCDLDLGTQLTSRKRLLFLFHHLIGLFLHTHTNQKQPSKQNIHTHTPSPVIIQVTFNAHCNKTYLVCMAPTPTEEYCVSFPLNFISRAHGSFTGEEFLICENIYILGHNFHQSSDHPLIYFHNACHSIISCCHIGFQ